MGDHLAEDRHGVQRGAVPPPVTKLVLALVDGELSAPAYGVHHLYVTLADLHLPLDETSQLLAGLLVGDAPHGRQLSQIPSWKGTEMLQASPENQNGHSMRKIEMVLITQVQYQYNTSKRRGLDITMGYWREKGLLQSDPVTNLA